MLEHMIREGIDTRIKNGEGLAAIHIAAKQRTWDLFNILVKEGSSLESEDNEGKTALFYAFEGRQWGKAVKLLRLGAKVNHSTKEGMTPIMAVFTKSIRYIYAGGNNWSDEYTELINIVRILLVFGAEVNRGTTKEGITPLHMAAHRGYGDIAEILLSYYDINITSKRGENALQFCKYPRQEECMPKGYVSGIPDNTIDHSTREHRETHKLLRLWLLKLRAKKKKITEEFKSETLNITEEEEFLEDEFKKELTRMEKEVITRQCGERITLRDVWNASTEQMRTYNRQKKFEEILNNDTNIQGDFRIEIEGKIRLATGRKKVEKLVKKELEKIMFLRHLQDHQLDKIVGYLGIGDLVQIANPRRKTTTEALGYKKLREMLLT
ncbi:ankyrin-1-like [Cotesia glomerata]|uniref:ankyrin-1-like n=1 Tax=Cotesia glomerata TaxID=32391 RepID=UPI001D00DCEF|nr:ankyrin-1-like [Cotesia glomerata]